MFISYFGVAMGCRLLKNRKVSGGRLIGLALAASGLALMYNLNHIITIYMEGVRTRQYMSGNMIDRSYF